MKRHIPGLDGLRGLAVLVVVVFHLGLGVLPGGYLGVDVFFVLSGFLITSLLLHEHERTGHIDLKRFWLRRARRLLPALLSLMPAVALYARFVAKPEELAGIRRQAITTLAYVANWDAIAKHVSYWQLFAAPSPLEHTWSLAIEEQFYVVWPLCVLLLLRGMSRRGLGWVSLGLAVLSGVVMVLTFDPESTTRAYFGTDTRAAGILLGAAYAAWRPTFSAPVREGLGGLSLLVFAAGCVLLEGKDPWLYHGGFWLVELGTLALIECAHASGPVGRLLALRPLTFLGTLSYGIYLWHWPVFCWLTPERVHLASFSLTALRLGLTLGIALCSFYWFERPIREHGLRVARPVLVGLGSFALCCALVFVATRERPGFAAQPAPTAAVALPPALARIEADSRSLPPASALPPGTRRILVLGDSVAQALGVAMRQEQDRFHAFVAERGVSDCSIMEERHGLHRGQELGHPNPVHGCAAAWVADAHELRPDLTVIVIGGGFMNPMWIDRKEVMACDPGWQEFYRARLHQLASEMGDAAGQLVLATTAAPGPRLRERRTLSWVGCLNDVLAQVAEARHVPMLDLAGEVCPGLSFGAPRLGGKECEVLSAGEAIRPDGLHPAGPGAVALAAWSLTRLTGLAGATPGPPSR